MTHFESRYVYNERSARPIRHVRIIGSLMTDRLRFSTDLTAPKKITSTLCIFGVCDFTTILGAFISQSMIFELHAVHIIERTLI